MIVTIICSLLTVLFNSGAMALESVPLPGHVIVVFSDKRPVTDTQSVVSLLQRNGTAVSIHNLDAVSALEKTWSKGLPNSEAAARAVFETRVAAIGKRKFEAALVSAYGGLIAARRHDIDRYPVVIFNHKWAVYGVTDLHQALDLYKKYWLENGERDE